MKTIRMNCLVSLLGIGLIVPQLAGNDANGGPASTAEVVINSRFDNVAKIGSIACPIFMAHGTSDELVPPEMLERLHQSAKSKVTVVLVNGAGHNNLFRQGGDSLYLRLKNFVNGLSPSGPTTKAH